ncbi:MAG: hypothetical protein QM644_19260 [Mobilitalea sp.]
MSRIKKTVRNMFIIIILSLFIMSWLGLYFTPLSAHENSERGIHYGPSKIIHIEDFKNGKYILGKYDKWVSCNTVNKTLLFFWHAGGQPVGFENDKSKKVGYTWSSSYYDFKAYGIVNDEAVKKIEVLLSNGEVLAQTDFYEDLFLLTWNSDEKENIYFKGIRGYDSNDNIVFEAKY